VRIIIEHIVLFIFVGIIFFVFCHLRAMKLLLSEYLFLHRSSAILYLSSWALRCMRDAYKVLQLRTTSLQFTRLVNCPVECQSLRDRCGLKEVIKPSAIQGYFLVVPLV
jgi:hypothetical protein